MNQLWQGDVSQELAIRDEMVARWPGDAGAAAYPTPPMLYDTSSDASI